MDSKYSKGKENPAIAGRIQHDAGYDPQALPQIAPLTEPTLSQIRTPTSVRMVTRHTAVSTGVVIPNLARISSDLMAALGSHASRLATKATNGEGLDSKDIDAIDKCVKALERLRDIEADMSQTETGKDVKDMSDAEILALMPHVQRMLTPTDAVRVGDTPEGGGGHGGPSSSNTPTKIKNET